MKSLNKTKDFLIMNLGCVLLACGVYFFKIPNGFSTGGVSGASVILCRISSFCAYALGIVLPLSEPLTNQPFMELAYAMLLTSVGSAMIFNSGASSGGTDIALYF